MQEEPGNKATYELQIMESMANKSRLVYAIVKVHSKIESKKNTSATQKGSSYVCICSQEKAVM